jgi:mannose-1-phosphate guanylyltransferase / mannose-6-phosphate isomerase
MKRLILAGGGGTRLWPLSRNQWPKQFLSLNQKQRQGQPVSLLCQTIFRACETLEDAQRDTFLITGANNLSLIQQDLSLAGLTALQANVITEPCRRNTAPAIALALLALMKQGVSPTETLAILPADHVIGDEPLFRQHLKAAEAVAQEGYVVTLGIVPTHPETGYGYIELEMPYQPSADTWYPVKRFVEKPDRPTAEQYLATQRYFWNAGIFVVRMDTLLALFAELAPEIQPFLEKGYASAQERFAEMPDISFDYAIMEKAPRVAVVPMTAGWSDVGSWDSVFELLPKDAAGNAVLDAQDGAGCFTVDCRNNLVWNQGQRAIGVIGLENTLIVDTPDALLVAKSGTSQEVRQIVKHLEPLKSQSLQEPSLQTFAWGQIAKLSTLSETPLYQVRVFPNRSIRMQQSGNSCGLWQQEGILMDRQQQVMVNTPLGCGSAQEEPHEFVAGEAGAIFLVSGCKPVIEELLFPELMRL